MVPGVPPQRVAERLSSPFPWKPRQFVNARELLPNSKRAEARMRAIEFVGSRVVVTPRADSNAFLTLNLDSAPIQVACKSMGYNVVAGAMIGSIPAG